MVSSATRIAVVEDHTFQRAYTRNLINGQEGLSLVYCGDTLPHFQSWLETARPHQHPDVILLDLMVDRHQPADPDAIRRLVTSGFKVLIFSALQSAPLVRRAVDAGVAGVVSKHDSEYEILSAIRSVVADRPWMSPELARVIAHDPQRPRLSDQEERSLVLYASGLPLEDVAHSLGIQPNTVKKYLQRVRDKYSQAGRPMRTRLEMNRIASADGYLVESNTDQL